MRRTNEAMADCNGIGLRFACTKPPSVGCRPSRSAEGDAHPAHQSKPSEPQLNALGSRMGVDQVLADYHRRFEQVWIRWLGSTGCRCCWPCRGTVLGACDPDARCLDARPVAHRGPEGWVCCRAKRVSTATAHCPSLCCCRSGNSLMTRSAPCWLPNSTAVW